MVHVHAGRLRLRYVMWKEVLPRSGSIQVLDGFLVGTKGDTLRCVRYQIHFPTAVVIGRVEQQRRGTL